MKIRSPDGRLLEVEDVDFKSEKEDWNIYKLSDGATLKIKVVMRNVYRTENFDPTTGDPIYHVTSTNIVSVIVPPNLKLHAKKESKRENVEVG